MPDNENDSVSAWKTSVRDALARSDTEALAELFSGAQQTWGAAAASRMWLEIASAFDANAVTG